MGVNVAMGQIPRSTERISSMSKKQFLGEFYGKLVKQLCAYTRLHD